MQCHIPRHITCIIHIHLTVGRSRGAQVGEWPGEGLGSRSAVLVRASYFINRSYLSLGSVALLTAREERQARDSRAVAATELETSRRDLRRRVIAPVKRRLMKLWRDLSVDHPHLASKICSGVPAGTQPQWI